MQSPSLSKPIQIPVRKGRAPEKLPSRNGCVIKESPSPSWHATQELSSRFSKSSPFPNGHAAQELPSRFSTDSPSPIGHATQELPSRFSDSSSSRGVPIHPRSNVLTRSAGYDSDCVATSGQNVRVDSADIEPQKPSSAPEMVFYPKLGSLGRRHPMSGSINPQRQSVPSNLDFLRRMSERGYFAAASEPYEMRLGQQLWNESLDDENDPAEYVPLNNDQRRGIQDWAELMTEAGASESEDEK